MEEISIKWKIIEDKYRKTILTEDFEFYIIELSKAKEILKKEPNNKLAQWMMFINEPNSKEVEEIMNSNEEVEEIMNSNEEIEEVMNSNEEIEEVMRKLDEIFSDKEMLDIITKKRYTIWENALDIQEAREKGEKIGIDKRKKRAVK